MQDQSFQDHNTILVAVPEQEEIHAAGLIMYLKTMKMNSMMMELDIHPLPIDVEK